MLGCTCIFKSYIYRRQAKTKKTYVTAGANLKETNIIYGERKLPYYLWYPKIHPESFVVPGRI
jgi:hypothetical protein